MKDQIKLLSSWGLELSVSSEAVEVLNLARRRRAPQLDSSTQGGPAEKSQSGAANTGRQAPGGLTGSCGLGSRGRGGSVLRPLLPRTAGAAAAAAAAAARPLPGIRVRT